MTRNGIDDQNIDDIIDDPQDILEEDVEDDDDNNNDVAHMAFINKKPKKFTLCQNIVFFSTFLLIKL